jgi:hypothetical protein
MQNLFSASVLVRALVVGWIWLSHEYDREPGVGIPPALPCACQWLLQISYKSLGPAGPSLSNTGPLFWASLEMHSKNLQGLGLQGEVRVV